VEVLRSLSGKTFNLANPVEVEEWQKAGAAEKCLIAVSRGCRMAAEIIMEKKQKKLAFLGAFMIHSVI